MGPVAIEPGPCVNTVRASAGPTLPKNTSARGRAAGGVEGPPDAMMLAKPAKNGKKNRDRYTVPMYGGGG